MIVIDVSRRENNEEEKPPQSYKKKINLILEGQTFLFKQLLRPQFIQNIYKLS